MAVHKKNAKREAKSHELATDFDPFPTLSFMEFVARDFPPSDIDPADCTSLSVPPLVWSEFNKTPAEVCVTNTGHHLNVEAVYSERRPSLRGSVLRCPYEFWCFHFNWGFSEDGGSVHRIMGKRSPMEIHLMFYNASYPNTDEALAAKDGILVLVYTCELTGEGNRALKSITSKLKKIRKPQQSARVDPFALSSLFDGDVNNYIMYWSQHGNDHSNPILWMISSKPVFINSSELSDIRSVHGSNGGSCRIATDSRRPRSASAHPRKLFAVSDEPCARESPWTRATNDVRLAEPSRTDYVFQPCRAADGEPVKIAGGALSLVPGKTVRPGRSVKAHDLEDPREADAQVAAFTDIWARVVRELPTGSLIPPGVDETGKTDKTDETGETYKTDETDETDETDKTDKTDKTAKFQSVVGKLSADTETRPIEHAENILTVLSNTKTKEPVIETKDQSGDKKTPAKSHRDGVRMNSATLRREQHIRNKLQKKL